LVVVGSGRALSSLQATAAATSRIQHAKGDFIEREG
jgi:hypothetical protein